MTIQLNPVSIFLSYAHEDEKWVRELEKHLSLLKRQKVISIWHYGEIVPSADWAEAIKLHLEQASIILLLVSADFLASDYCYGVEMARALERHEVGQARVIPIAVRPTSWKGAPFAHLQALPTNGNPISLWNNKDEAFVDVEDGIRGVIEELKRSVSSQEFWVGEKQSSREARTEALSPFDNQHSQAALPQILGMIQQPTPKPARGTLLYSYKQHRGEEIYTVAWHPSGKYLASSGTGRKVKIWEGATGQDIFQIPPSPTQDNLGYWDYYLRYPISPIVRKVAWSPDGNSLAFTGSEDAYIFGDDEKKTEICVWDIKANREKCGYIHHNWLVTGLSWSPDGKYIASTNSCRKVEVWNATTGENLLAYDNDANWRFCPGDISWSPNGEYIASTSGKGEVQIWNFLMRKKHLIYKGHSDRVFTVSWSPDSKYIASASNDGTIQTWEALTGEHHSIYRYLLEDIEENVHVLGWQAKLFVVAWSPNGKHIASTGLEDTVQIWDVLNHKKIFSFHGHSKNVNAIVWSPDGTCIASAGDDGRVLIWQAV